MMRKVQRILCLIVMLAIGLMNMSEICFAEDNLIITVDDKIASMDTKPYINAYGTAMMPVRFFVQNLCLPVDINIDDINITNGHTTVGLRIKDSSMTVNNTQIKLDTAPEMYNNRIYVPLRQVCEALDFKVNRKGNIIDISTVNGADDLKDNTVTFEMADKRAQAKEKDIGNIAFEPMTNDKDYIGDREKHVLAFVMGTERTKAVSGAYRTWNNAGRDGAHVPDNVYPNGLRDIGSVFYPSIGLYDVSDPDYQEYRMQLFKMTYIDTASLYTIADDEWYKGVIKNVSIPLMKKYGITACLRLSTTTYSNLATDDSWKSRLFNEVEEYIDLIGESNLMIDGRPVLTIFDSANLDPEDIRQWKSTLADDKKPFIMRWLVNTFGESQKGAYDGMYDWAGVGSNRNGYVFPYNVAPYSYYTDANYAKYHYILDLKRAKDILDSKVSVDYYADSVSPGFDSLGVWGWGSSPTKVDRGENGELYEFKWKHAAVNQFPMVCIPTWDDWGEASGIEPTLEYGNKYLEITRKYAAEYKGIIPNDGNLNLPDWIYKIRKTTDDIEVLSDMEKACDLIVQEKYGEAEAIVQPYVEKLNICDANTLFNYPKTETKAIDFPEENAEVKDGTIPVVSDDKSVLYYPVEDTYIRDGASRNSNFAQSTVLTVKNADSGFNRKIFIKFDTTNKILNNISSAKLRLYISSLGGDDRSLAVYDTTNDWEEDTLVWTDAPSEQEIFATIDTPVSLAKKWVEVDISELVKKHYGNEFSMVILNRGQKSEKNQLDFGSRELMDKEPQLILR